MRTLKRKWYQERKIKRYFVFGKSFADCSTDGFCRLIYGGSSYIEIPANKLERKLFGELLGDRDNTIFCHR
jgi:hypothetical protein